MGIFSKFEGKVDDAFDGISSSVFKSPIEPTQIAKKCEKQMHRNKLVGKGVQYAPTLYTVLVNSDDDRRLFGFYPTMAGELETYLVSAAEDAGLGLECRPLVRFIADENLKSGKFDVIAEVVTANIVSELREEEAEYYGLDNFSKNPAPIARPQGVRVPNNGRPKGTQRRDYPNAQILGQGQMPQGNANAAGMAGQGQWAQQEMGNLAQEGQGNKDFSGLDNIGANDYGDYGVVHTEQQMEQPAQNAAGAAMAGAAGADGLAGAAGNAGAGAAAGAAGAAGIAAGAVSDVASARHYRVDYGSPNQASPNAYEEPVGGGMHGTYGFQPAVLVDARSGVTFALEFENMLIGREATCDIVLPDASISRTHARISRDDFGNWNITDLNSTNGTSVNGRKITTSPLRYGDQITVGTTVLLFQKG